MVAILFAVLSILVFRFRSRAALELKVVALQHQLTVLCRQRPRRPQLSSLDWLLWVLLYRIWPQVIDAMGTGQARHRDHVASQGLPVLLALSITASGTPQDQCRNP